ncbi:hypothetical protein ABH926_009700 [Catenulispora sp. GP43]
MSSITTPAIGFSAAVPTSCPATSEERNSSASTAARPLVP